MKWAVEGQRWKKVPFNSPATFFRVQQLSVNKNVPSSSKCFKGKGCFCHIHEMKMY